MAPPSVTFTTANWNLAQTVTVTGVNDDLDDGDVAYTIVTAAATSSDPAYSGLNAADVSLTNTDNDTAGITVNPTAGLVTTEGGRTANFTIVLATQPTANVTIGLSSNDTTEGTVAPAERHVHDRQLEPGPDGDSDGRQRRPGRRGHPLYDRDGGGHQQRPGLQRPERGRRLAHQHGQRHGGDHGQPDGRPGDDRGAAGRPTSRSSSTPSPRPT